MARTGWILTDSILAETYVLPVNPNQDKGSFSIAKTNAYQSSVSNYRDLGGGVHTQGTLIYAQPNEMEKLSFSGNAYTSAEIDAWEYWVNKGYPITLTDDLGRIFLVLMESIVFSRKRSRHFPFKHTYELSGFVLAEI